MPWEAHGLGSSVESSCLEPRGLVGRGQACGVDLERWGSQSRQLEPLLSPRAVPVDPGVTEETKFRDSRRWLLEGTPPSRPLGRGGHQLTQRGGGGLLPGRRQEALPVECAPLLRDQVQAGWLECEQKQRTA